MGERSSAATWDHVDAAPGVIHRVTKEADLMPWIKQVPLEEASGLLKKLFDEAIEWSRRTLSRRGEDKGEPG